MHDLVQDGLHQIAIWQLRSAVGPIYYPLALSSVRSSSGMRCPKMANRADRTYTCQRSGGDPSLSSVWVGQVERRETVDSPTTWVRERNKRGDKRGRIDTAGPATKSFKRRLATDQALASSASSAWHILSTPGSDVTLCQQIRRSAAPRRTGPIPCFFAPVPAGSTPFAGATGGA